MAAVDVLRAVLRAEEPPEAISTLGFTLGGDAPNLRIGYPKGRANVHTFPLADLATGFVRAWVSGGTNFTLWASVIVMTDWIDVEGLNTSDGRALWEAVWTVSGGDQPADDALALARHLSGA